MFGERFAHERKKLGLNQNQLAEKLGLGRSTIGMIETDRVGIDAKRLVSLGPEGFDVFYILTGEPAQLAGGRVVNWDLTIKIVLEVQKWARSRKVELSPEKIAAITKILYFQLAKRGTFDAIAFNDTMKAAA